MDTAGVSGPVGSGSWLSYEKLCPIAIAYCTIMMAVWIPIEISNSYTIHGSATNVILTGEETNEMIKAQDDQTNLLSNRINSLKSKDTKGPKGDTGQPGDRGEKGTPGQKGIKGNKGRRGSTGSSGPKGNDGKIGVKGERGIQGPKGNSTGDPGPPGPKGEKGEKGDSPPTPSLPTVFNISATAKGDIKVYQTFCWGTCRDITVKVQYARGGDADLYTKEGSPPSASSISSSSGCSDCLCTSKNSNSPDVCFVTTSGENSFYTAVYAHKSYRNGNVTFDGPNYKSTTRSEDESRDIDSDDTESSK